MFFAWKIFRMFLCSLVGVALVIGVLTSTAAVIWMMILIFHAISGEQALLPMYTPSVKHFLWAGICFVLGLIPLSIIMAYEER